MRYNWKTWVYPEWRQTIKDENMEQKKASKITISKHWRNLWENCERLLNFNKDQGEKQIPFRKVGYINCLYKLVGNFLKPICFDVYTYNIKYRQCRHSKNMETPHGKASSPQSNLYSFCIKFFFSFFLCSCYNYKESCLVSLKSSWNFWNIPLCRLGQCFFHYSTAVCFKAPSTRKHEFPSSYASTMTNAAM